jgi:phage shock protein PspC (stress-responsive transcriptional regulator)
MQRLVRLLCILLTVFPAFGQSTSKYQVGTITEVKVHQTAGSGASDTASYDVSVKVVNTIYVVLYTPPLGEETVKYAAGRDLLVLVGKNKITYNDILGRSYEVPIESQKPVARPGPSRSASHAVE